MRTENFSFGWFIIILCVTLILGSSTGTTSADSSPQNSDSPLGANLHVLTDWSSEYTFVDAFKQSRPWMTQKNGVWDTKESHLLDLDENGWPRSLPAYNDWSKEYRWITTLMFNGINGHYPAGKYIVLYDGTGTIEYGFDAQKNFAESNSHAGRDVIDVVPGRTQVGISLSIKATDIFGTGDHIRNIRVLMPGFDETNYQTQTFHPTFLTNIGNYKVLRFMDWMRTNWDYNENGPIRNANEPEVEWSHPLHDATENPFLRHASTDAIRSAEMLTWDERAKPVDSTFASEDGVPVETMIALSNETGADPWFNMPHLASDDYIEGFAQTVFDSLDPHRRIYVEYSNEVWNSGFGQAHWVQRAGIAEWPDSTVQDLEKRLSWFGQRSAEMCNIWKAVYDDVAERVICVLATQASNSWIGKKMLDCPLSTLAPCHEHMDAIAIAPYFGQHIGDPINYAGVSDWTGRWDGGLTKLFNELHYGSQLTGSNNISQTSLNTAKQYMEVYADIAAARTLNLVAYEGGQHLSGIDNVAWDDGVVDLFSAANRDERMTSIYDEYLTHWNAAGGEMFVIFSSSGAYSRWGNWGIHEYADSLTTVKYGAVSTYIAENVCDWELCFPFPLTPTTVTVSAMEATLPSAMRFVAVAAILWAITLLQLRRASQARSAQKAYAHAR